MTITLASSTKWETGWNSVVRHYDDRHPVLDWIFRELFIRFGKEGIEIPFNQMDVHIKKD
ncbi:MAG: hypothetical protein KJ714_06895 [Euryarchaeota archaeon]|nr:hypothetical protein [Euryarchaeota archaeon]